ncbi:PLP-dependent aminotransferase family protein [Kibdelosporangium philippinense]|uniref:PLP-dependent aminotransferase family protein n=1 Tax=Kibdelosporangium philippinense TaxID=211113 RepID=A0ABS8ZT76_9PSEU|nr:PLP-dependent aminotransferase family protein [Kibdelosporangium philippinense]MCE7010794.1 PLP-dependent aminotransferase family protein [Kibdelosporangium philippinense]
MTDEWSSSLDVHLDWTPGLGRQGLAKAVRQAIRDGRWKAGAVVPSTRALAHDLGVARGTVTRVYSDLAAEGYLQTSQGAPTRVATAGAQPLTQPRPTTPREPAMRWNLMAGRPDAALFPRDLWLASTKRVLQHTHNETFGWGEPRGSSVLRATLSAYLARSRGVLADPARIVVCSGFSHAMTILGTALRSIGIKEMAFEDPSFWRFRDLAGATGQKIVGVPVDGNGMRVSELTSPAVVVTPAHQSPIGVTLAPDRRAKLTETGAVIVEDDYDGEFRYDRHQVGALQALAPERVIYAGTASKTLAPSLRIGWMVLPRSLVDPVIAALETSGAQPSLLDQLILADMISTGAYDRHVRKSRIEYRSRRDRVVAALPKHLIPQGISAGLHLTLPLSEAAEADVRTVSRRHSLAIETVSQMSMGDKQYGLLVGYGAPSRNAFGGALEALLNTLRELRE